MAVSKEEKKMFSKIEKYKPTLWERIMLWFAKPYYGVDLGCGKDKSVEVKCKKFRGKIYILEVKET